MCCKKTTLPKIVLDFPTSCVTMYYILRGVIMEDHSHVLLEQEQSLFEVHLASVFDTFKTFGSKSVLNELMKDSQIRSELLKLFNEKIGK